MSRVPNEITAPDAASLFCLLSESHWRGTGEFFR
jgi:hypothetical protein